VHVLIRGASLLGSGGGAGADEGAVVRARHLHFPAFIVPPPENERGKNLPETSGFDDLETRARVFPRLDFFRRFPFDHRGARKHPWGASK
jgi:hypothetical protein